MQLTGTESYLEASPILPPPKDTQPKATQVIPFIVAIDTREQHPFTFQFAAVPTRIVTLRTGDYSILGMEQLVCVERKSKEDLYGSVTRGRARFEKEMQRMQHFPRACVVVESSPEELRRGMDMSRIDPEVVFHTALSWSGRYHIPWYFVSTRAEAERLTLTFLRFAWRDFISQLRPKETPHD